MAAAADGFEVPIVPFEGKPAKQTSVDVITENLAKAGLFNAAAAQSDAKVPKDDDIAEPGATTM